MIKHHGAVDGVTGSCHELVCGDDCSVLIDCGLFQGAETSGKGASFEQLEIEFPVEHIQALIVTHVHIDHVGRIPYLLAAGFKGPIYCSEPSALLLPLVLEDALKIGFTRNRQLINKFLKKIQKQLRPLPYKKWHTIIDDGLNLKVKLSPAGHILGSAYVEFLLHKNKNHKQLKKRFLFSGDLGAPFTPLLPSPKPPYRADTLVIESTYGDRNHEGRHDRRKRLKQVIESAIQNRGTVLIPAFSIGRTQELLYEIEQIIHGFRNNKITKVLKWDDIEVIIDSPLAAKFTECYRQLRPFWDKEAKIKIKMDRHPLAFEQMVTIDKHETHLQTVAYLAKTKRPAIVIAASGMCTGGRVVNYLKALISDERNDILFVGYQAKGTAGRDIQKYGKNNGYVELDGERYTIKAGVHSLSGYSAHADQHDLINFVKRMRVKPKEIRIVHGDEEAKRELKEKFEGLFKDVKVVIP
jgi:metallo-beta-lactamase family protein